MRHRAAAGETGHKDAFLVDAGLSPHPVDQRANETRVIRWAAAETHVPAPLISVGVGDEECVSRGHVVEVRRHCKVISILRLPAAVKRDKQG